MYAARNLRLCTKDCICLFVCPTGATNTENGQIDPAKCVEGCRACVDACPSHAIHLVMEKYPEPVLKNAAVADSLLELGMQKLAEEGAAQLISEGAEEPGAARLARALAQSARILAEDCTREAGYLTPQCNATHELLSDIAASGNKDQKPLAEKLITLLEGSRPGSRSGT
jgi:Fe-S-cluster-containing dehydrogenase component